MPSIEAVIGHWIAIFITIAILSYLYADNPFYKVAEHLFIGTSIGYVIVVQYFEVIRPNLIDRLLNPALGISRAIYFVPLLLVVMLFIPPGTRVSWLRRIPIAFIIGIYAGRNVPAIPNSDLVAQLGSTIEAAHKMMVAISAPAPTTPGPHMPDWAIVLGTIVLIGGLAASLVYFFFSIEHKGVVGRVARIGVMVLMVGFGASFGYTVQGRISLAIGRAMEILGVTQSEAEQNAIHPKLVSALCVLLIFGTVFFLERRRARLEKNKPPG